MVKKGKVRLGEVKMPNAPRLVGFLPQPTLFQCPDNRALR